MILHLSKLPPRTQEVLRLNQIDPAERQAIIDEFAAHKFKAIVLTGPLSAPNKNLYEVGMAFRELNNRIEKSIQAKKAGQTQPAANPPPGETRANPPPKENKKSDVENILDLFKKKKD